MIVVYFLFYEMSKTQITKECYILNSHARHSTIQIAAPFKNYFYYFEKKELKFDTKFYFVIQIFLQADVVDPWNSNYELC